MSPVAARASRSGDTLRDSAEGRKLPLKKANSARVSNPEPEMICPASDVGMAVRIVYTPRPAKAKGTAMAWNALLCADMWVVILCLTPEIRGQTLRSARCLFPLID